MTLIIDRFEGSFAVVEVDGKKIINISKQQLPPNAKGGDVLIKIDETHYSIDQQATERIKQQTDEENHALWNRLEKNNDGEREDRE